MPFSGGWPGCRESLPRRHAHSKTPWAVSLSRKGPNVPATRYRALGAALGKTAFVPGGWSVWRQRAFTTLPGFWVGTQQRSRQSAQGPEALLRSRSRPQPPLLPWGCCCSERKSVSSVPRLCLSLPEGSLAFSEAPPREPPTPPEALIFFPLSIRHLFLIDVLTLKLCVENEEKETLCGAWGLFKAWRNCFRGCMFFIPFMRDACFPPSVTCLKVKFNMLPEKLLVNNLISNVLGIMGEK